jgi:large subunit ribosomal protein L19
VAPAASSAEAGDTKGGEEDVNVIQQLEREQQKKKTPALRAGDTVRVHAKVVEGTRERIQVFEGTVIRVTGGGLRQNFTVRRVTHGVGVERTFMVHSPRIDKIDVLRHGDVRQGRLYYLRGKVGREARIRERRRLIAEGPDAELAATEPEGVEPVADESEEES